MRTERSTLPGSFVFATTPEHGSVRHRRPGDPKRLFVQYSSQHNGGTSDEAEPKPTAQKATSSDPTHVIDFSSIVSKCVDVVSGINFPSLIAQFRKTLFLVYLVFLLMLFCLSASLWQSRVLLRIARGASAQQTGQSAHIASHILRRLSVFDKLAMGSDADVLDAGSSVNQSAALRSVLFDRRGIQIASNASLRALHQSLSYKGPLADIEFLVNQHVDYEENLKNLAVDELTWLAIATRRDLHNHHNVFEKDSNAALHRVASLAYDSSRKWAERFYGNEQLMHRYWYLGEDERRRVVRDASAELSASLEQVKIEATKMSWWRFSGQKRSEVQPRSNRWLLLPLLAFLIFLYSRV